MPHNTAPSSKPQINLWNLGLRPYEEVWQLQKELQRDLIQQKSGETLILCEHPPTITLGTGASPENIIAPLSKLESLGVKVVKTERGGDVTYHGPGQLVAYPILDLNLHKRDVHWYMRMLEESIIMTLADFGLSSQRIAGRTGVWTCPQGSGKNPSKIAALGVRISRWCTMHGVSLNVLKCNEGFELIYPCGFRDIEISSMQQELNRPITLESVAERFASNFFSIFS